MLPGGGEGVQPKKTCTAYNCKRPVIARGMCTKHYQRWKAVTPKKDRPMLTLEERFWAKVEKTETCWVWKGAKSTTGYGRIYSGDKMQQAHRVSYELHGGTIPDDMVIDHICKTTLCVRPDHLRVATTKQNIEYLRGAKSNNVHSGERGVYKTYGNHKKPWRAQVRHNNRDIYLGSFETVEEAAKAAAKGRAKYFTFPDFDERKVC